MSQHSVKETYYYMFGQGIKETYYYMFGQGIREPSSSKIAKDACNNPWQAFEHFQTELVWGAKDMITTVLQVVGSNINEAVSCTKGGGGKYNCPAKRCGNRVTRSDEVNPMPRNYTNKPAQHCMHLYYLATPAATYSRSPYHGGQLSADSADPASKHTRIEHGSSPWLVTIQPGSRKGGGGRGVLFH